MTIWNSSPNLDTLNERGALCANEYLGIEMLNGPDAPSYAAGTENFYTITRYNWSSYYAMAMIELAETVAREMHGKP